MDQIIVLGGEEKVQSYVPSNPAKNEFFPHSGLALPVRGFCVSSIGTEVFIVGGNLSTGYHSPIKSCSLLEVNSHQWSSCKEMTTPRCATSCVAVGRKLFVLAGRHEKSCEVLDLESGEWSDIAGLSKPLCQAAAVVLDDKIYLIGGHSGAPAENYLAAVQVFDIPSGKWMEDQTPMPQARHMHAATALENSIMVSGGVVNRTLEESCLRLDPRSGQWTPLAPMHKARSVHALVKCDGHLRALGGDHHEHIDPLSVEEYDSLTDTWKIVEPLLFTNEGYHDYVKATVVPIS